MDFWKRNTSAKSQRHIAKIAKAAGVDAKAVNILFNSNWNLDDEYGGWKVDPTIPADDFEYGLSAGILFENATMSEQEVFERLVSARDRLNRVDVADAFICSLSNDRFDYQHILPSYACFLSMNEAVFSDAIQRDGINGLMPGRHEYDFNRMQFSRISGMRSGFMQDHIIFAILVFEEFAKLPRIDPTDKDRETLTDLLDALRSLSGDTKLTDVRNALKGTLKRKQRQQTVLETLALCDILQPHGFPSMWKNYYYLEHCPRPSHFYSKEWRYPMCHWKGSHGVNEEAVGFWFPGYGR